MTDINIGAETGTRTPTADEIYDVLHSLPPDSVDGDGQPKLERRVLTSAWVMAQSLASQEQVIKERSGEVYRILAGPSFSSGDVSFVANQVSDLHTRLVQFSHDRESLMNTVKISGAFNK